MQIVKTFSQMIISHFSHFCSHTFHYWMPVYWPKKRSSVLSSLARIIILYTEIIKKNFNNKTHNICDAVVIFHHFYFRTWSVYIARNIFSSFYRQNIEMFSSSASLFARTAIRCFSRANSTVKQVGIVGVPFDKGQRICSSDHLGPRAIRNGGLVEEMKLFNGNK